MESNVYLEIFKKTHALLTGHFRLTSGLHSDKYFQCALVLQYPEYTTMFCQAIADEFSDMDIDTVISPAIGGIVVGTEAGRLLNKKTIFAERKDGQMVLRRGFTVAEGERFLICEDVVTTGGSVFEVIDVIKKQGGIPVGVGFIVDRSHGEVDFGVKRQFSLFQMEVITYAPDDCPLCEQGFEIVKPGSRKT